MLVLWVFINYFFVNNVYKANFKIQVQFNTLSFTVHYINMEFKMFHTFNYDLWQVLFYDTLLFWGVLLCPGLMFLGRRNLYYGTFPQLLLLQIHKFDRKNRASVAQQHKGYMLISTCQHILCLLFTLLSALKRSAPFLQKPTNVRQCRVGKFLSNFSFLNPTFIAQQLYF